MFTAVHSVVLKRRDATILYSGTPLETSKRRFMNPVLYTQLLNWVGQLGVVSKFSLQAFPNPMATFNMLIMHS